MQQREPPCLQLVGRRGDTRFVGHLEFEAGVRDRPIRRPDRRAKACLRGLRQRPDTEMLAALDALAEIVLVAFVPLERQPESVDEELAALRRVGSDDRDAGNEQDLHLVPPLRLVPVWT